MEQRDTSILLNSFILLLGILLGTVAGLGFMIRIMVMDETGVASEDPETLAAVTTRIEPVGRVMLMGSEELEAAAAAVAVMPERVDTVLTGPQVYNEACFACHSPPGVGGAPVIGDSAAWSGRVDQGRDTMIDHALNGYTGDAGYMPPKGGRVDLSDDEVISAVDYMIEQLN